MRELAAVWKWTVEEKKGELYILQIAIASTTTQLLEWQITDIAGEDSTYQSSAPGFNSLGSEFSSQGHFHTLQLLNVPQFLFCRVVMLKTAPRGNFSHT